MIGMHFLKTAAGLLLVALVACDNVVPKPTDESAGSPAAASPTVIQFEIAHEHGRGSARKAHAFQASHRSHQLADGHAEHPWPARAGMSPLDSISSVDYQ